jgi:hypothetical protein
LSEMFIQNRFGSVLAAVGFHKVTPVLPLGLSR